MIAEPEQLKLREAGREIEKPQKRIEGPEEKLETPEALMEFGEQTAKKVRKEAEEVITAGNDQIESATKRVGGKPEDVETGKAAIAPVQEKISALVSETQRKIQETSELEAKIGLEKTYLAESEPRELLPKIGKSMEERLVRKEKYADIPGINAIDPDQEIDWEHLVFVRATDVVPKIKNGSIVVETPYSGTKSKSISEVDPRTTTHWAVNHHVRSSPGGWRREGSEQLPFIIIAPGKGMREKNPKPRNFADVDTFWDQDLTLPENTVIVRQPGTEIRIPQSMKGKIHIIDRDPNKSAEEDIADIIDRLGFTPIKGGYNYSKTEGVAEVFDRFASKEGLESGIHQVDETNRFEKNYSQLDDAQHIIHALEYFLDPDYKPVNDQARELLERKLQAIAKADALYIQEFAAKNRILPEKAQEIFDKVKELLKKKHHD